MDPVEPDLGKTELTADAQQAPKLLVEDARVREEDDERADADRAVQHAVTADDENDRGGDGTDHGGAWSPLPPATTRCVARLRLSGRSST